MENNNRARRIPADVVRLATDICELPPDKRQHVARLVRALSGTSVASGRDLLIKIFGTRPESERYFAFEQRLREAQQASRRAQR